MKIEAQDFPPIRVERTLEAKSLTEPKPGVYVLRLRAESFGRGARAREGPAGRTCKLRFAEMLNADGTLYTENLRTAQGDRSLHPERQGVEEFTPQFTFHGFRYAELTGLPSRTGKGCSGRRW